MSRFGETVVGYFLTHEISFVTIYIYIYIYIYIFDERVANLIIVRI